MKLTVAITLLALSLEAVSSVDVDYRQEDYSNHDESRDKIIDNPGTERNGAILEALSGLGELLGDFVSDSISDSPDDCLEKSSRLKSCFRHNRCTNCLEELERMNYSMANCRERREEMNSYCGCDKCEVHKRSSLDCLCGSSKESDNFVDKVTDRIDDHFDRCSVCGDGLSVTNPDAKFDLPGELLDISCGSLQEAGEVGIIPFDMCGLLTPFIKDTCGCNDIIFAPIDPITSAPVVNPVLAPVNPTSAPANPTQTPISPAPTRLLTQAPISRATVEPTPRPPPKPSVEPTPDTSSSQPSSVPSSQKTKNSCSVCGDGKSVTEPDAFFVFPGQPDVACGKLEEAGRDGTIPLNQCGFLPALIEDTCGCKEVNGCSVCGDGKKVGKPEELFAFPDQPVVACGALESAGKTGVVPLNECGFLWGLIKDICGCIPITQAIAPTRQPAMQQPYVPPTQVNGCSVCGDGKNISFPDVLFSYPGQPSVLCSQLENDGYTGLIPQEYCAFLPGLITGVCGCDDASAPSLPPKDDDSIGTNGGYDESVSNGGMNPNSFLEAIEDGIGEAIADIIGDKVECGDTAYKLGSCFKENYEECSNCNMNHPIIKLTDFKFVSIKEEMTNICPEIKYFYEHCGCHVCKGEKKADFKCHCNGNNDNTMPSSLSPITSTPFPTPKPSPGPTLEQLPEPTPEPAPSPESPILPRTLLPSANEPLSTDVSSSQTLADEPTTLPTNNPSSVPSLLLLSLRSSPQPSSQPSGGTENSSTTPPTINPTILPTSNPTFLPTNNLTSNESSSRPSSRPSGVLSIPPTSTPTTAPSTSSEIITIDFPMTVALEDPTCSEATSAQNTCFRNNPTKCKICLGEHPILNLSSEGTISMKQEMTKEICLEMEKYARYCGCDVCKAEKEEVLKCYCDSHDDSSNSGSVTTLWTGLTIIPLLVASLIL